jgi:uncharacterized membrane protein
MDTLKRIWGMMDEKMFMLLWVVVTAAAVLFMAPGTLPAITEIIIVKMIYVAILLSSVMGLLFFLRGTQYDVYDEIFIDRNLAAAMLVTGMLISVAMVVGK